MPLFGKKKEKSPKRKLEAGSTNLSKSNLSLGEAVDAGDPSNALVKLKLGNNELLFQDGEWISEGGGTAGQGGARDTAEYKKIQKRNLQLQEENNYLNYKIEVLLDMLAATTADCNVFERELETLQTQKRGCGTAR